MKSHPLTAAVIAQDEAAQMPGLLAALRWADEVLLVDGGSQDGTRTVARAHGARVALRPFDNFAAQRNAALAMARGDWVLFVDADERPEPGLAREVRARIGRARHAAFRVPVRSIIFGRRFRFAGTQDDLPVRLVRRDAASFVGDVHESPHIAGRVGRLQGGLRHRTLPDLAAFLAKMNRYTALAARSRLAAGKTPRPGDAWRAAVRETLRRLCFKHGWLDGPEGWAFCLLSGLSEWVLAREHRRLWMEQGAVDAAPVLPSVRSPAGRIPWAHAG